MIRRAEGHDEAERGSLSARIETRNSADIIRDTNIFNSYFSYPMWKKVNLSRKIPKGVEKKSNDT